jgi:hypothetical protein
MSGVSERVMRKILADFPDPGSGTEVARQIASASEDERVQAAIVLAAQGDLQAIQYGVELAAIDWRDLLVNGGLANENWQAVLDLHFGPATAS